uniref:Uncharacterized protein n=1 Tax=Amphimedon queenslandica TaxID=400682 RepID=A0A1X7SVM6_AMPQE
MSICGLFDPKTKPVLHYPVSLNGIECPVTLSVHRVVKSTIPASPIISYTGIVYYERKEDDYLVSFIAARNLKSLVNYIEEQHPLANIVKLVNFDFNSNLGYIKLNFNATTQDKSLTQWTTEPQSGKLFQMDVDNFDDALDYPQSCLISFYGTPDAAQSLQYYLSLEGVADGEVLYIGLVYYEWKLTEYLMTFIAGKKGTKLIQYVEEYHPLAEIDQIFTFSFSSPHGFIELIFDSSYDDSCEGWTVQPFVKPCRLYQDDIDRFDDFNYPFPPFCLTSVHGSFDAVPKLRYSIPLKGVVGTMAIFIDLKLRLEKDIAKLINELHSLEATFKEEMNKKDGEIAASKKKLYDSLQKQSIIAKEKQELSERMMTLIKEQEIPKKPESLKLFDYDVSKLEIVLQPMEDLWFQLGHQLNVEVSLLSDIQETKDTKEQMRSLLQLCSDKGVTMMQLEGALEAMDQKSLIPVLQEFSKELEASLSTDGNKRLLELELEETKAALDTCKSKQQEQEAVEEMLKNELILKDKTISEFVKEKSQLLELINQLKDEKQNEIRKQQSLVEQLQESRIDQVFKEKLQENSVGTQSVQQQSTKE